MASQKNSEDVIGNNWDLCVANTMTKMGGGVLTGALLSLVFFKRKSWPVLFGFGFGAGMAYSQCQNLFDQPYLVKPDQLMMKLKKESDSSLAK